MLAIFLAHQMSVIAARRRIVEEQAETTEELAPKAPHSDLSRSSFRDICRTCLGTSKLQPIFCNSLHDEMSQKLKVVTGLEVIKPIPQLRRRRIFPPLPKDPPFICPTCSRDCPTRAALFTHYRGHTHYFVCEDCGKRVLSQFALLQHQRAIHGLTKIHKCSYCDYSAADKGGLVVHERRHTGERPFVCDYCGAGFTTRTTLRQHIGVHMPATIQCPLCPKRLRSEFMLSKHKAAKHGKRYSYQCPSCPKSFTCVKSVRSHLRVIHKMPSSEQPKIEKYLLYSLRNDIAIT